MTSERPLTEELASFFAELQWEKVPDPIRAEAKRLILDTLGCIVGGSNSEHAPMIREVAGLFGTTASGDHTSLSASYAYNRLANIMDFDESIGLGYHFGPGVVSSALAIAERQQLSGQELVLSVIAGYELGYRVAEAMGPYGPIADDGSIAYPDAWGIAPPVVFGAVGAAAKGLGLDADLTADAYAIAAALTTIPTHNAWFKCTGDLPNFKYMEAGWLAMIGTYAALAAQRGARAYPGILDGDQGYLRMLGLAHNDRNKFLADLGKEWRLSNVCYKPWPGQWWVTHPLTALDEIVSRHQFDADKIDRVVIETTPCGLLPRYLNQQPGNFISREFSYSHSAAMMLLGVPVGLAWLSPDDETERRAAFLRDKIEVVAHPDGLRHGESLARGEGDSFPNRVTVHIGETSYQAETEYARGIARAPRPYAWGNDEAAAKFRLLVDAGRAEPAIETVLAAEKHEDLSVIFELANAIFAKEATGVTE